MSEPPHLVDDNWSPPTSQRDSDRVDGGRFAGAIDCDVHNAVADIRDLYPYLEEPWREFLHDSNNPSLAPNYYPVGSPLAARPGARLPDRRPPGSDLETLVKGVFDATGSRRAILNCLYGVQAPRNPYLGAALSAATNDWLCERWLAVEPRLCASILVPTQDPDRAADEIRRRATHPQMVAVLMLARTDIPLGNRHYWPIYRAASESGLPITVHAGGATGTPTLPVGWARYYLEEYIGAAQAFQSQLVSLVAEGVFSQFPTLQVVFAEAGFTWLPSLMWRFDKNWKGLRREVPWVDRLPSEIIKKHVRFTIQPFDQPDSTQFVHDVIEQIDCDDMLLFSTDYPHWQYDDEGPMPVELDPALEQKIIHANAERTYRLP